MIKLFQFSVKKRIINLLLAELLCRLILHLFLNIETFNLFFYSLLCKNVRIEWILKQILGCSYINEHKMENYHWYKKKCLPTRLKIQDPVLFLSTIWLPHGELWVIIGGKPQSSDVNCCAFINSWLEGHHTFAHPYIKPGLLSFQNFPKKEGVQKVHIKGEEFVK